MKKLYKVTYQVSGMLHVLVLMVRFSALIFFKWLCQYINVVNIE